MFTLTNGGEQRCSAQHPIGKSNNKCAKKRQIPLSINDRSPMRSTIGSRALLGSTSRFSSNFQKKKSLLLMTLQFP